MERFDLTDPKEQEANSSINKIIEKAQGIPIALSSAPTTTTGELKANQWGFDGSNLYINLQGTTYRISLTAV